MFSAWLRVWRGEPDLALEHAAHAMRLSPLDPSMYAMNGAMAYAHFLAGRYDMASSSAKKAMRDNPTFLLTICVSVASNALAGRLQSAQKDIAQVLDDRFHEIGVDEAKTYGTGIMLVDSSFEKS
jgi:hypothetical protein